MEFSTSLKLNHIFRRLYATSGHANTYLVLYARRNRSKENRVGLTCGKKLGHAVVRNRTRRLREIYRLNEHRFARGYDIVVVARSAAVPRVVRLCLLDAKQCRERTSGRSLQNGSSCGVSDSPRSLFIGTSQEEIPWNFPHL